MHSSSLYDEMNLKTNAANYNIKFNGNATGFIMGKLIHPSGNLNMHIEAIGVDGEELCITAQMGVWDAKILMSPDEVAALARSLFKPQLLGYFVLLPWRIFSGRRRE